MNHRKIVDYSKISCGCCTGRTDQVAVNWRIASDQCVCWQHQDISMGRPAKVCGVHAPKAEVRS